MLDLVFVGLVIEELDLGNFLLPLLDEDVARFDHVLARSKDLLYLVEVVLLYSLQKGIQASSKILNPL